MGKPTRREILEFADTLPGAQADQPFAMDFDTTILRHAQSRKWFGAILHAPCRQVGIDRDGETEVLNLKCDPLMAYGLMEAHFSIVPGYHMNKHHWISVVLGGDVTMELLTHLIMDSYRMTEPKKKKNKQSAQPAPVTRA